MESRIRLALIYGSARPKRLCDKIVAWALSLIEQRTEFEVELIDPREYPLFAMNGAAGERLAARLREDIERADAFIVVTPEYNHGYPASLKALIDAVYFEWHAKPVAFISYGGLSGGIRAVEQLRQVFAELHAATLRDGISFANVWDQFDEQGNLLRPQAAEQAMSTMLAQLLWWGRALRNAREAQPYKELVE